MTDASDGQRFEALCMDEWPRLVRALTLVCGDQGTAEEVVQEALLRALVRWRRVKLLESPVGSGGVRHVAVNLARSRGRRRATELRNAHRIATSREIGPHPDPINRLAVTAALQQLSPEDREVVVLRYYLDMSHAEVAQATGSTEEAVRARVSRAVRRLRPSFEAGGVRERT